MPLAELHYFSQALQKQTRVRLLLPTPETPKPWPVMFLLHGLSDDETIWTRHTSIERYVAGSPFVVVMPDGGRGFYTNAVRGPKYWDALSSELPELIRQTFQVGERWCATGLSMGGYGALKLALRLPELFVSASSHSGATFFASGSKGPIGEREAEFVRILGEDLKSPDDDLTELTKRLTSPVRLRLDCGTEDFLLEDNRAFHSYLSELGVEHTYEEFPGEHNWEYWDRHVVRSIAFHLDALGISPSG